MRLLIGYQWTERYCLPREFSISLSQMADHLRDGKGPPALTYFEQRTSEKVGTDVARNEICRYMLQGDFSHLLFVDADHVLPIDLVEKLAAHDKPVITARYHVRRPPYHANAYVDHPLAPPGEFKTVHYGRGCFEIDRGGAGALLIRRDVLEAIGSDWFLYQRNPNPGEHNDFSVSEDFWFWKRAKEEGFSCWVDWETEVGHLATIAIGHEHNVAHLEAMAEQMTPELAAQLISCGTSEPIMVGGYAVAPFKHEHPHRKVIDDPDVSCSSCGRFVTIVENAVAPHDCDHGLERTGCPPLEVVSVL